MSVNRSGNKTRRKDTQGTSQPVNDVPGEPASRSGVQLLATTGGLIALAALAYSVHVILSPFVLVFALVYLLAPFRKNVLAGRLMWLGVILFSLWFVYSILGLLEPFLIAFLLAYVLDPTVSALEARGIPRWASSLIAILLLIGLVVSALLFVVPLAIQQFRGLLNGLGQIVADISDLLKSGSIFEMLAKYGIPVDKARETITNQLSPRLEDILKSLLEAVLGFVTSLSGLVMQLVNAIIIPFLAFYILMDFPAIIHQFHMMTPRAHRERVGRIGNLADAVIGKYLRGAVIVALIQGCIAGVGLWLIGVNYPLVLGMMTGILDFIPYVGLVTSLIVSSAVAVFSGGNIFAKIVAIVIMYLSQKLLEATVLSPKIVGKQVGLHPALLILCLLVFGYFVGFVGLLIAVPTTALIIAGVKEWELARKEGGT